MQKVADLCAYEATDHPGNLKGKGLNVITELFEN